MYIQVSIYMYMKIHAQRCAGAGQTASCPPRSSESRATGALTLNPMPQNPNPQP